jgi:hypothetical protein
MEVEPPTEQNEFNEDQFLFDFSFDSNVNKDDNIGKNSGDRED